MSNETEKSEDKYFPKVGDVFTRNDETTHWTCQRVEQLALTTHYDSTAPYNGKHHGLDGIGDFISCIYTSDNNFTFVGYSPELVKLPKTTEGLINQQLSNLLQKHETGKITLEISEILAIELAIMKVGEQ